MDKYQLRKEEIVVQLHYILKELYPDKTTNPEDIIGLLEEDGDAIIFHSDKLADLCQIDAAEMTSNLYRELGIEYEKNLHDKFYFKLSREDTRLIFKMVDKYVK